MVKRLRGPQECPPEIRLPFVLRHHYSQGTNGLLGPCLVTLLDGDKWDKGQPAQIYQQPPGLTQPHPLRGGLGFARDREEAEVGAAKGAKAERREWAEHTPERPPGEGQGQGRFREQEAEVQAFVQQSSIEIEREQGRQGS